MRLPEGLALYESWSLTRPTSSSPSRLYCLVPANLGTADSESLTSYIARLAQAHHVTAAALFGLEIAPLVERNFFKKRIADSKMQALLVSSFRGMARAANGTGRTADDLARAVATLTLRSDVRLLTMKPWANVFARRRLLRLTHAACFACYQEWRIQDKVICDPLLWALQAVTVCPKHGRPLSLECSFCRSPLWPLASHSRPGHCAKCGEWLGTLTASTPSGGVTLTDDESSQALWAAKAVGELIAATPALASVPTRETVAQAIAAQTCRFAGRRAPLARLLHVNHGTLGEWQRGETVPELGGFLRVCFHLNLSPVRLLTSGSVPHKDSETPAVRQNSGAKVFRASRPGRPVDLKEFHDALQAALDESPPPTFKEIACRLNRRPGTILHHFPREYRILVLRHARHQKSCAEDRWNRAKRGLEAALHEEPPPPTKELATRLGCSLPALRQHNPSLYRQLGQRHTSFVQGQRVRDLKSKLDAALTESPLPTFQRLAPRLGYSRATLLKYCPDLVRHLIERSVKQRQTACRTRWDELTTRIRQVALEFHQSGVYPSVRRVCHRVAHAHASVGNPRVIALIRSIREELGIRGARQALSLGRLEP